MPQPVKKFPISTQTKKISAPLPRTLLQNIQTISDGAKPSMCHKKYTNIFSDFKDRKKSEQECEKLKELYQTLEKNHILKWKEKMCCK